MSSAPAWLSKLTLRELHRIAVEIGSPCSGTKPIIVHGIQSALHNVSRGTFTPEKASIVSIDMGVRNLAYCHLKPATGSTAGTMQGVEITSWQKRSIEQSSPTSTDSNTQRSTKGLLECKKSVTTKESYEPSIYAARAHSFVKDILRLEPTHILIERQRFRSGGQAAVQEWSIRVGIFEAMLYAVLQTLKAESPVQCQVLPVLPIWVNKFWLEPQLPPEAGDSARRLPAGAVKSQKVDLVRSIISAQRIKETQITFSEDALDAKTLFQMASTKRKPSLNITRLKLDDLSDCLLQGLAWIQWQRNRQLLREQHLRHE